MPEDHFPNHPDAACEALTRFGVDVNQSYRRWTLELAGTKAADVLAIESVEDGCVICGAPVSDRAKTCSPKCRTRLWRLGGLADADAV